MQKKGFEQWALSYNYDPVFGYLIQPEYQPRYFNKKPLTTCLEDFAIKMTAKLISHEIQKIGQLNINFVSREELNYAIQKDYMLLHAMLSKILCAFINQKTKQGFQDDQIVVPKNIALPLYKVSKLLGIKVGMTTDFYFNWYIPNCNTEKKLPEEVKLSQIQLINYFTQSQIDQRIFFAGAVLGTHYFTKNIKLLFQINRNIQLQPLQKMEQNIKLMKQIELNLHKINVCIVQILNSLNGQVFYYQIRKLVRGFTNVKFEGVQQLQSSTGGAGGNDPTFQIFENMIGLKFQGRYKQMAIKFQQNFPNSIKRLIKQIPNQFLISDYFRLTQQLDDCYKSVMKKYADFLSIHKQLINPSVGLGTAGEDINDILLKSQVILNQIQSKRNPEE